MHAQVVAARNTKRPGWSDGAVDLVGQTCHESEGMEATPVPICPDGAPWDPARVRDALNRRLQIVTGKGGVGRTTVSCALALRSAQAGHRTLLLEVDAPDSAAAMLGVQPAVDVPREVENNLWLCRMTPVGALHEYALMVLRFKPLYNLVFENRLVKYLLRSIPSLGEFTMLGKAWFHSTETLDDGSPRYERILMDAPATGHAVTLLALARLVANISPGGVMKDAAVRMAELIESKDNCCMHVVTLPEEMPVNEGIELVKEAQHRLRIGLGIGIANRVLAPMVDGDDLDALGRMSDNVNEDTAPYIRASILRRDRERWQAEHLRRFVDESRLATVALPDILSTVSSKEQLKRVVGAFAEAVDV